MNHSNQSRQIKRKGFSIFFIFSALLCIFLTSCANSKVYIDEGSIHYDIKYDGQINISLIVYSRNSKTIEVADILIDIFDENDQYLETIEGTTSIPLLGLTTPIYINPGETKTIEIYAYSSNQNMKYIRINNIDFQFVEGPNFTMLWIVLAGIIGFIILTTYFTTRATKYYDYNGHRIKAATRFIICYIEIDGKRIASKLFLRWGATINVEHEGINIKAMFHSGFICPIITIVADGLTLNNSSK